MFGSYGITTRILGVSKQQTHIGPLPTPRWPIERFDCFYLWTSLFNELLDNIAFSYFVNKYLQLLIHNMAR